MPDKPFNLAIVDDHWSVRTGFANIMDKWPHGRVLVQAENGLDYEQQCAEVGHIHIAIIDLRMPLRDGFDTFRWMRHAQPRTRAIALSFDPYPSAAQLAVQLGACGVLAKNSPPEEVLQALDNVHLRKFHYNDFVDRALHRKWVDEGENKHPHVVIASLTPRELEFTLHYARPPFPSLEQISALMGLKPDGAESIRKLVVQRTGCHRREELIQLLHNAEVQGKVKG